MDFVGFSKIPRLSRECIITEKIDGTNAQIVIEYSEEPLMPGCVDVVGWTVRAGSKNRYIFPNDDNHGFARWVEENKAQLIKELGIGRHFGEWWGQGINSRYRGAPKSFSLFNAGRWQPEADAGYLKLCKVVPIIAQGLFCDSIVHKALSDLYAYGSKVWPGAIAEGIIVYHTASASMFKKTIDGDEKPKGKE